VTFTPQEEDVDLMRKMRTIGLLLVTMVMSLGALGIAAPAHADTSWYCPTCLMTPHPQR